MFFFHFAHFHLKFLKFQKNTKSSLNKGCSKVYFRAMSFDQVGKKCYRERIILPIRWQCPFKDRLPMFEC